MADDFMIDRIPPREAFPSAAQVRIYELHQNGLISLDLVRTNLERGAMAAIQNGDYDGVEGAGPASRYNYVARMFNARPIGELRRELPRFMRRQEQLILDLLIARRASQYFAPVRPRVSRA